MHHCRSCGNQGGYRAGMTMLEDGAAQPGHTMRDRAEPGDR
jgi:hypothetical protein